MTTTPRLTLGLQSLRAQIDAAFPNRDKTSDGWIGDTAHQAETSGHNPDDTPGSKPEWDGDPDSLSEVRAVDVDSDLNDPNISTQALVDWLLHLPGIASVFRYIIFNRKMYHVDNDFEPVPYTGASPHIEHFHVSGARNQTADNNTTFDFKLGELVMDEQSIAAAVKNVDIDDGSGTQSLGGALVTSLSRSKELRETTLPSLAAQAAQNGSALTVLLGRPVVDPSTLAAQISASVVQGVLTGLAGRTTEETAALIVDLLGADQARAAATVILASTTS